MKKIFFLFSITLLLLALSSCKRLEYSEPEQVYLVAAMGIDILPTKEIRVSLEIPLVRENESDEVSSSVFIGTGTNFEEALANIKLGSAKKIVYSHCALLAMGESVDATLIKEILGSFSGGEYLPLATQVVYTPDANELLKQESISTHATGYDIPGILQQQAEKEPIRCRIYELAPMESFSLPTFIPAGEERAEAFLYKGLFEISK